MRYRRVAKSSKRHILDEFCANCGDHPKYAIRLLNGPPPETKPYGDGGGRAGSAMGRR